jgi:hypothetical protein
MQFAVRLGHSVSLALLVARILLVVMGQTRHCRLQRLKLHLRLQLQAPRVQASPPA